MTQTWSAPPTLPPANWYPDPSGVAELRYWNGWNWTVDVVVAGRVTSRPMPPPPAVAAVATDEHQLRLPARAAVVALVGFGAGFGAAVGLGLVAYALGLPRLAVVVICQVALWAGMLGAVREVSRRFGTGHPLRDFRVQVRWSTVGWGLLMSVAARMAAGIAIAMIYVFTRRFGEGNDDVFRAFDGDIVGLLVVAVLAVVGAPIVEELFFRGVVQGSFLEALGTGWAVILQAVLFGLVHINPVYGLDNVTIVAGVTAAGIIFGITVRLRGLGSAVFAHSLFNLVGVISALALT